MSNSSARCCSTSWNFAPTYAPHVTRDTVNTELFERGGYESPHALPATVEGTLLVQVSPSAARHNRAISRCFVRLASIVCDHLVACRHHQSRFAGVVHAAKPARVEKRTAFLFFVEASIQGSPSPGMTIHFFRFRFRLKSCPMKTRTPANCERSPDQTVWKWD